MRICIPVKKDSGLNAEVSEHFGGAPYFLIYDTNKKGHELIKNNNQHHAHGMCQPLSVLDGKDIGVVVCAGMGARAVQRLNEAGICAYRTIAGTAAAIVRGYNEGQLEEITTINACTQHNCH